MSVLCVEERNKVMKEKETRRVHKEIKIKRWNGKRQIWKTQFLWLHKSFANFLFLHFIEHLSTRIEFCSKCLKWWFYYYYCNLGLLLKCKMNWVTFIQSNHRKKMLRMSGGVVSKLSNKLWCRVFWTHTFWQYKVTLIPIF